jgi:hypothetical protein
MLIAALAGGVVLFLLVRAAAGRRARPRGEGATLRALGACGMFGLGIAALSAGALIAALVAGAAAVALTVRPPAPLARRARVPALRRRAPIARADLGVEPRASV